jgi:hypothetical protein
MHYALVEIAGRRFALHIDAETFGIARLKVPVVGYDEHRQAMGRKIDLD